MSINPKNVITVIGYLSKDPEVTALASGSKKTVLTVPVDRIYKDNEGNKITDWFLCDVFGQKAETAGDILKKGYMVAVTGSMQLNKYEKDGETKLRPAIMVENFQILSSPKRDEDGGGAPSGGGSRSSGGGGYAKTGGRNKPAATPVDDDFSLAEDELPPF
jgi:single-strand DNA-binding protein